MFKGIRENRMTLSIGSKVNTFIDLRKTASSMLSIDMEIEINKFTTVTLSNDLKYQCNAILNSMQLNVELNPRYKFNEIVHKYTVFVYFPVY